MESLKKKATDIHFLNDSKHCTVNLRINESLVPYKKIKKEDYEKFSLYIKYKSQMNLNISKSPQSSALNMLINDELMRIRVSTLPSYESESIVLRINHHQFLENARKLLLYEESETIFLDCFKETSGLILLTGPTCSGKTTLTYCLLNQLKKQGLSIVTIEDPIECYEQGFVQLQVNEHAGVTYDSGVKEILRHDPDIILIGEIRDEFTARSAIRAGLTGHMVVSTMHATTSLKALYRLLEFGLSIMDLEQTLNFISNQRLIVHNKNKKIILEYLKHEQIIEALYSIKTGKEYSYHSMFEDLDNNLVIKR